MIFYHASPHLFDEFDFSKSKYDKPAIMEADGSITPRQKVFYFATKREWAENIYGSKGDYLYEVEIDSVNLDIKSQAIFIRESEKNKIKIINVYKPKQR